MDRETARKKATEILEKDSSNFALRSCWECNGAHEHLKNCAIPLNCFECGKWFFKGIEISEQDEKGGK